MSGGRVRGWKCREGEGDFACLPGSRLLGEGSQGPGPSPECLDAGFWSRRLPPLKHTGSVVIPHQERSSWPAPQAP